MTKDELYLAVQDAVVREKGYVSHRALVRITNSLAPLLVDKVPEKPLPSEVVNDGSMIVKYDADSLMPWKWSTAHQSGAYDELYRLEVSDDDLERCLKLRKPIVGWLFGRSVL